MMSSAERAEHCERMAALTEEPEARSRFIELARLWRGIAADSDDAPAFSSASPAARAAGG
jgi:hypothetical protein